MSHRTRTTLRLGTISEGTLKDEDIVQALVDALDPLHLTRDERTLIREVQKAIASEKIEDWMAGELASVVDAHVPAYAYYGSLEGDGAHLGVWPGWEAIEDGKQCKDISEGYSTYAPYALFVNDHGNVTLMRRAGHRWVEEWSVV